MTSTTTQEIPQMAPPPYSDYPPGYSAEMERRSSSSSFESNEKEKLAAESHMIADSSSSSSATFMPTVQLQLETPGKRWLSWPFPGPKPDPIPIWPIDNVSGAVLGEGTGSTPVYVSVRPERGSGTCFLVRGDGYRHTNPHMMPKLSTTTYRFGPGRPPCVRAARHPYLDRDVGRCSDKEVDDGASSDSDTFDIDGCSSLSRSVKFQVPSLCQPATPASRSSRDGNNNNNNNNNNTDEDNGYFMWRYASSRERAAPDAYGANSLLVLEYIAPSDDRRLYNASSSSPSSSRGKATPRTKTRVAQLVRNDEWRSPGSTASTAGNGGRLMLDLAAGPFVGDGDDKTREQVQVLAVTTALVMLKKEVDRRRATQIAIMGGAASGGGG